MPDTWRFYIPAGICFLLALVFMAFPHFAAFLMVMGLIGFGVLYIVVVSRFLQWMDTQRRMGEEAARRASEEMGFSDMDEPTFRNVSIYMVHQGKRNGYW